MDNSTLNIWLGEKERNEVIPGYPPSCQLHNTVSVHVCILSHSLCLCSDVTNFSQERIYYMCVTRSVWSVFLYTVTWNWLQGSQQNIGFFFKTHNRMLIKLSPPPPQKKTNKKTNKQTNKQLSAFGRKSVRLGNTDTDTYLTPATDGQSNVGASKHNEI